VGQVVLQRVDAKDNKSVQRPTRLRGAGAQVVGHSAGRLCQLRQLEPPPRQHHAIHIHDVVVPLKQHAELWAEGPAVFHSVPRRLSFLLGLDDFGWFLPNPRAEALVGAYRHEPVAGRS